VEVSAAGPGPSIDEAIYSSPMVLVTDHPGPSAFTADAGVVETADIRAAIDPDTLCLRLEEKARLNAHLATICPVDLRLPLKGLDIDPAGMTHVYGLGQEFRSLGSADGDWTAHGRRQGLEFGNGFQGFQNAAVGNVQIPVMYALGPGKANYALLLDNVYRQTWDFTGSPWQARMFGDQLRFYVMTGPDLPDLRSDYMELTGRPPVPPRKAFGLWVSEFGYDDWEEIDALAAGLRLHGFPLDGFVLDLNWFGGIALGRPEESEMGRLDWDRDQEPRLADNPYSFPDPAARVGAYADGGIGLVAIEESYLADSTATFAEMPGRLGSYRRTAGRCDAANQAPATGVQGFWGTGRMIDWTDPAAGAWIHAERRFPNLADLGVTGHWTDLGEPESFDAAACYEGVETTAAGRKNEHADVHNLYNLMWNKAIWDGYAARAGEANRLGVTNPRPFILTRSGAAGTQAYGAAMWSGDIASNLESLATHMNAQMHMSMSGIDYYGSDIGGFRREVMPWNDKAGSYRGYEDELYTQWFANGAWFDVPVRPHTDNEFVRVDPPYATSPDLVGRVAHNFHNIRQRYELIPYYYSLAWRAHLFGEPVVPPLVYYYQDDPNVRRIGHEKLVGRDLLVAIVARHGEYARDVYLPAGRWVNFHSNEWTDSAGEWLQGVPVYRHGLFRLPAFARAGAILPKMPLEWWETTDAFGRRHDGVPTRDELIVRVYADSAATSFTLYEDDGTTLAYDADRRPLYHHRTTVIRQQAHADTATVTVEPAADVGGEGPFPGAVTGRAIVVELVVDGAEATGVTLDGMPLPRLDSENDLPSAASGWVDLGRNLILAKAPRADVYGPARSFAFALRPVAPTSSVTFVCDRGFTSPGTGIYVVGSLPELGGWDPARAVSLIPSISWAYVSDPPPGHNGPGPSAPVWTHVIYDLPPGVTFEWKCLRRREDGGGAPDWEPGPNNVHTTAAAGYAGLAYGSL
jgi:alpha-glucosidase